MKDAPTRADIVLASARVVDALERALPASPLDAAGDWRSLASLRAWDGDVDSAHQLDAALAQHDTILCSALRSAGMPEVVLELLRHWMTVQLGARAALIGAAAGYPYPSAASTADPMTPLDARAMGQALGGLSDQIVRDRERRRELFSILRAGRKRGREYPAFQAWEGIAGAPLACVLQTLRTLDGERTSDFFSSRPRELGGLTPVESLTTHAPSRPERLTEKARALISLTAEQKLSRVVEAAETFYVEALRPSATS